MKKSEYIIIDLRGARHGTVKALNCTEALDMYMGDEKNNTGVRDMHMAVPRVHLDDFRGNAKKLK